MFKNLARLGVNTVTELVDLLKRNPGKYNFGSIGNGSVSHLAMEAVALASTGRQSVAIWFGKKAVRIHDRLDRISLLTRDGWARPGHPHGSRKTWMPDRGPV